MSTRCTCKPVEDTYLTTYGSCVDPNTQWEWCPDCPEHGEANQGETP